MKNAYITSLFSTTESSFWRVSVAMAIQNDYLKTAIHESVAQYNRISKSKTLNHLVPQNERRMLELINRDKKIQSELQDTLSKKDYYTGKMNKLLNSLIDKNGPGTFKDAEGETLNSEVVPLDSRFICNRHHAKAFIEKDLPQLIQNEIKKTIARHFEFQKYYEDKRKELAGDATYNEEQLKDELDKLDNEVFTRQKVYEKESVSVLKKLNIPFFNLAKGWEYPDLESDKAYILDLIVEVLETSKA